MRLLHPHLFAVFSFVCLAGGCILAPTGECGAGSNPKEHACRELAQKGLSGDAGGLAADAGTSADGQNEGPVGPAECAFAAFVDAVATLDPGASRDHGSCGGAGPEHYHEFTAPESGTYEFATRGATFDPVLYVRRASCHGAEEACNDDDDAASGVDSRVSVYLSEGETVVVVVDAYSPSASGRYELRVNLP